MEQARSARGAPAGPRNGPGIACAGTAGRPAGPQPRRARTIGGLRHRIGAHAARRIRAGVACAVAWLAGAGFAAAQVHTFPLPVEDRYPGAAAAYLVAVDGVVRWAKAPDERRPVASLAKLLAALVLVEMPEWSPTALVTIGPAAAGTEGVRLGLRAGEQASAQALLEAMLVASRNDACLALAEHAAGSAAAFAARMNRRAAALGLRDSHFVQPCGLDRPGQFSSASDLLRLTQAVLADPRLVAIAALPDGVLRTAAGRGLPYRSSNLLLGRVDGATGLKTGTTQRAGHCLVATARRDGHEVIVVLLDAGNRWTHAAILLEEGWRAAVRP
jgi:D-alanyl-D-alanine carboxypeptidase (penicillin-binding protein 5/6)